MANSGGVSLEYWLQWQVPICALILIIPSTVAAILIKKGPKGDPNLKQTDLWVPSWTNLHPSWLLLYRALALATMVYLLYLTVHTFGFFVFLFYTQWTFALVILYLLLATIVSARGCWSYNGKPIAQNEERYNLVTKSEDTTDEASATSVESVKEAIGNLEASMEVVYQICAGAVILTDIVFWCILVPFTMKGDFKLTLLIGCMHSVNVIFLLLDSAFNSLPFTWNGLTYLVMWSSSYVTFQWVLHACCISWWPYPFLELATPSAPLWYLALALIHIPCYGLYMLLVRAKNSLFSRVFPSAFRRVAVEKMKSM
ncbi:hypothetical protein Leryth_022401 [Lithospermum erythrorhizon]|nr:hypothetical protein Leryth_022401 [Lithospermum erythrorhizon]